ncbi:hypothetical protein [Nocardia salmonicida]|uniref:hypothetical protein n=1 Tax=Nocardia salmonicida TaxID=53431 RepID=UPI0037BD8D5A
MAVSPVTDTPIPVAVLFAEGFGVRGPWSSVDSLARELDEHIVYNDIGQRCVTRDHARHMFAERAQQQERQRQRRVESAADHEHRRAELEAQRARRASLAAQQREQGGGLVRAPEDVR